MAFADLDDPAKIAIEEEATDLCHAVALSSYPGPYQTAVAYFAHHEARAFIEIAKGVFAKASPEIHEVLIRKYEKHIQDPSIRSILPLSDKPTDWALEETAVKFKAAEIRSRAEKKTDRRKPYHSYIRWHDYYEEIKCNPGKCKELANELRAEVKDKILERLKNISKSQGADWRNRATPIEKAPATSLFR